MNNNYYLLYILTVLIFSTSGISQTQVGMDIDGENAGDESGKSVSMSADGSRVAIGALSNDGNGNDSGHVRVYNYNPTTGWEQLGEDINGEAAGDESGWSVSLSADGSRVAIGSRLNEGRGQVRVFSYNVVTGWQQLGNDIAGEMLDDFFGHSLSMNTDGSRLAISAISNDGNGNDSGHVQVYEYDSTLGWQQLGEDIDGEAELDSSGFSVSMSANGLVVAIGTQYNDGNGERSGHVRVYEYIPTIGWQQLGEDIDGNEEFDGLGFSVSISADGSSLAAGAPYSDNNGTWSGYVQVYDYNTTMGWIQRGEDINGEATDDLSGWSVSMSADGSRVAIGALSNDGNGNVSGHARVFDYSVNKGWQQRGIDIDGEAMGDRSGQSLSLSGDGSRLAIGAPLNDGNGFTSGHVRVYLVGEVLSINEIAAANGVFLYPNPTIGLVNLDISQVFGTSIRVTVVEAGSGKLVKNITAITGTNQLEFTGLANGVYILKIESETASSTHRMILAK